MISSAVDSVNFASQNLSRAWGVNGPSGDDPAAQQIHWKHFCDVNKLDVAADASQYQLCVNTAFSLYLHCRYESIYKHTPSLHITHIVVSCFSLLCVFVQTISRGVLSVG